MKSVARVEFNIDMMPGLYSPIMGVFATPGMELTEAHIQLILQEVENCKEMIFNRNIELD